MSKKELGKWDDLQIGPRPQNGQVERAYNDMLISWITGNSEQFNAIRKNLSKHNRPKQR